MSIKCFQIYDTVCCIRLFLANTLNNNSMGFLQNITEAYKYTEMKQATDTTVKKRFPGFTSMEKYLSTNKYIF